MTVRIEEPFDVGDRIRIRMSFRDLDEALQDPDTIDVRLKPPALAAIAWTKDDLEREELGVFYRDHTLTVAGSWAVNVKSTGAVETGRSAKFPVREDLF